MDGLQESQELDNWMEGEEDAQDNPDIGSSSELEILGMIDDYMAHRSPRVRELPEGVPCSDQEEGDEEVTGGPATTAAAAAAAPPSRARSARVRRWMLTWNNPPGCDEDFKSMLERCPFFRGGVFQRERGESGTPHYQAYVECSRAVGFNTVKQYFKECHIEAADKPALACQRYCTKEDTRISGPHWINMKMGDAGQGKRTDVQDFAKALIDPAQDPRDVMHAAPEMVMKYSSGVNRLLFMRPLVQRTSPRRVIIMVGPTGCGKTRSALTAAGADFWWKPAHGMWFDGYVGQKTAIFDEVTNSDIPLSMLLQLLDRYVFYVPIKGSYTAWTPDLIVLTSNVFPSEWFEWIEDGKRKHNMMSVQHFRALARRVTEFWHWNHAGEEPRKFIRRNDLEDEIDMLFEGRFTSL